MNNKYYTVCGIIEIEGKVLLVRHTYGNAKDRILLPGGFVQTIRPGWMTCDNTSFHNISPL